MNFNQEQRAKIKKLLDMANKPQAEIIMEIIELESKFDNAVSALEQVMPMIQTAVTNVEGLRPDPKEKEEIVTEILKKIALSLPTSFNEFESKVVESIRKSEEEYLLKLKNLTEKAFMEIDRVEQNSANKMEFSSLENKIGNLEQQVSEIPSQIVLDGAEQIATKINTLDGKIDPKAIRGWNEIEVLLKKGTGKNGLPRDFDVRIGVSKTELQALTNRVNSLEATSVGNVTTPTGTVNASNTSFTTSVTPTYIVADGVTLFEGAGYSFSAPTITMDNPPYSFIRVIS